MDVEVNSGMIFNNLEQIRKECGWWVVYLVLSTITVCVVAFVSWEHNTTLWNSFVNACISVGIVTSAFWTLWVIKRIVDITSWWKNLGNEIIIIHQSFNETKSALEEIKQITSRPR
jgi:hypothetical protein